MIDLYLINKVYEIRPIDEKIYIKNHFILENKEIWWEVFENGVSMGLYDRKCFETLKEIRENKLKELGI